MPNDHPSVSRAAHGLQASEFAGLRGAMRYRGGMRLGWIVVTLGLAGCGSDATSLQYMDDDFPAGGCRDTEGAGTTSCDTDALPATDDMSNTGGTTDTNACAASDDCIGGHCVAPWDPATEARGEFTCEFACIGELDERRWCSDDASCCDTAARCTARGYCIVEGSGGSSTGDTTSTSGSSSESSSSSSSSSTSSGSTSA
jgi:hypothetical protein